jgi:hypothetical protein
LVVRPTRAVVVSDEVFTSKEATALAEFLAGYSGLTREAYALDLRQYVRWCTERAVTLFGARRADIESFGRHLETLGRARATIARRLCTITCFGSVALSWTWPRGPSPVPFPVQMVRASSVNAAATRRWTRASIPSS